jgi:hypothetical protein
VGATSTDDRPRQGPALGAGRIRYRLPVMPRERRIRAVRDGLLIAGWLASGFVLVVIPMVGQSLGYDTFAFWSLDLSDPYARSMAGQYALGGFRYAPPVGLALAPLGLLPWWLQLWLWLGLLVGLLCFLGGRWTPALLALPAVALELYHGNVHLLLATAVAIGFRHPWAWSIVLLTKVTPGIGLAWFAIRREWRALGIAAGATVGACLVSLAVVPGWWPAWFEVLAANAGQAQDLSVPPALPFRLPLALLLVAWGARTERPWTVPFAATLALPIVWPHGLVVALGAVPLLRHRSRRTGSLESGIGVDLRALARPFDPDWSTDPGLSLRRLAAAAGFTLALAIAVAFAAAPAIGPVLEAASANLRL